MNDFICRGPAENNCVCYGNKDASLAGPGDRAHGGRRGLHAAKQTVRAWANGGAPAAGDRLSRGRQARGRSRATAARAA